MLLFILIFTFSFIIFIECYFGSILFRRDSTNKLRMNIPSLLYFLVHPLHNSFMWNKELVIGNYPFMIGLASSIYLLLKNLI